MTRDGFDRVFNIETGAMAAGGFARDGIDEDWGIDAGAVGLFFAAVRLAVTR